MKTNQHASLKMCTYNVLVSYWIYFVAIYYFTASKCHTISLSKDKGLLYLHLWHHHTGCNRCWLNRWHKGDFLNLTCICHQTSKYITNFDWRHFAEYSCRWICGKNLCLQGLLKSTCVHTCTEETGATHEQCNGTLSRCYSEQDINPETLIQVSVREWILFLPKMRLLLSCLIPYTLVVLVFSIQCMS